MTDRDQAKTEKPKGEKQPASTEDDERIAIELPLEENDQNAQPT